MRKMNVIDELPDYPELFSKLSKEIALGDSMFRPDREWHYFEVGASALSVTRQALQAGGVNESDVLRVLDYACGYGRVLRWLKVGFTQAEIHGVDIDPKAVDAAASVTGAQVKCLNANLDNPLGSMYDLIWVGSLLTHLTLDDSTKVIQYLKSHLNPNGLLVFTTHGHYVAERIRSGAYLYNLDSSSAYQLLDFFESFGYGFVSYSGKSRYGISISSASKVSLIIESCKMQPVFFRSRGWDDHQDVFACTSR